MVATSNSFDDPQGSQAEDPLPFYLILRRRRIGKHAVFPCVSLVEAIPHVEYEVCLVCGCPPPPALLSTPHLLSPSSTRTMTGGQHMNPHVGLIARAAPPSGDMSAEGTTDLMLDSCITEPLQEQAQEENVVFDTSRLSAMTSFGRTSYVKYAGR
jgi:hypothetical protein